ncbi:response regulator [Caballeronia sp. S22]|uniref:response regulator n=1 Tax=Caballeronia sp. S22 TaxID=3137182 RepID=UPI003530CCEB
MGKPSEVSALDESALEIPVPGRDFGAVRRSLLIVLLASVFIPIFFIAGYGYASYENRVTDSAQMIGRLANIAEARVGRILDAGRDVASDAVELLGVDSDAEVLAQKEKLALLLHTMARQSPAVEAVCVFGPTGRLLVSNLDAAASSNWCIRDNLPTRGLRKSNLEVSLLPTGARGHEELLDISLERFDRNGRYLGIVSVLLRRSHLLALYEELTAQDTGLTLGLYTLNGGILARFPPPRLQPTPDTNVNLMKAIGRGSSSGEIRLFSTLDGVEKLLSYRRVATFPVYVTAGLSVSSVVDKWLRRDGLVALATLVPCVGIWLLVGFSLRRLNDERLAWERWRTEVGMRLSAEAKARQMTKMSALGNLVASVAHDFNNLLMVVKANMELARRKGFNGLEKEVTAVERAATGAEALARKLLSVSRKQPLRQEVVQLGKLVEEAFPLLTTSLGDNVDVQISTMGDAWPVLVDPHELESALVNIAVNAKQAMPHGGRFSLTSENAQLPQTPGLHSGEYLIINCSDNGVGMSAAVAQRAFEPLFTTKSASAGAGLGLAQVFAMCEQAGGTARIESALSKGTTVRLYFPRYTGVGAQGQPSEKTSDSFRPVEQKSKGSILLVEDNDEVAAGLVAVLEVFGWDARHESSGDAALAVLQTGETFDLILSDIQMPGQNNGIDVAEKVRNTWPQQAIALMTGYADELERAKHAGVTILAKPFNIDDLQALLERVHISSRVGPPDGRLGLI